MEIVSITEEAKAGIVALCNRAVTLEYVMIVNYPRIIDHIRNFEKIEDAQILQDIDSLGRESLGHFNKVDRIVNYLGGTIRWEADMLPRLVGVEDMLGIQLDKEREALATYTQAKEIALNNKKNIKIGGFMDRLLGKDLSTVIPLSQVVNDLNMLISDEDRHARLAEDIIATHKSLISKKV
ncbi:hypothetical protein ACFLYN_05305 [Chloroflexota bacterium]